MDGGTRYTEMGGLPMGLPRSSYRTEADYLYANDLPEYNRQVKAGKIKEVHCKLTTTRAIAMRVMDELMKSMKNA